MVMNETPFSRRDANRRGGFTLIEVVIALAIFVFGALAIIRIFPPALGVIQNSGDRMVGTNFNRSVITKTNVATPDGTFDSAAEGAAANWNNGTLGSVAGTRRNNTLPNQNILDYDRSALGHFKNIVAEPHTVPASQVILTQFPFVTGFGVYREDTVNGVQLLANGTLDFSNATRASDGSNLAVPGTPQDTAYVSYRWVENGRFWNVDEERVELSTATPTVFQQSRTAAKVVPGEVTVRLRSPITPASSDPDRGRIILTASTSIPVGSKITVDYKVKDWRWLVYDGFASSKLDAPAANTTSVVNLPIRNLDSEQPNFLYTTYPSTSPTPTAETTNTPDPDVIRTGRIPFTFTPPVTTPPAVRVVYRTADNWAQQLSVAAKNYTLAYGASTSSDFWRECAISTSGGYLYFHPSEAGKTVQLSYTYGGGANPAADKVITNRILTIDQDIISPVPSDVPTGFAGTDGAVARLQLTDVNGNFLAIAPTSIQKIKGASIQARTAWLDGDRFNQVSSTSFRTGSDQ